MKDHRVKNLSSLFGSHVYLYPKMNIERFLLSEPLERIKDRWEESQLILIKTDERRRVLRYSMWSISRRLCLICSHSGQTSAGADVRFLFWLICSERLGLSKILNLISAKWVYLLPAQSHRHSRTSLSRVTLGGEREGRDRKWTWGGDDDGQKQLRLVSNDTPSVVSLDESVRGFLSFPLTVQNCKRLYSIGRHVCVCAYTLGFPCR